MVLVDYDAQGTRHNLPYFPKTYYLTVNDGNFKPPRRELALFRVSKQIHKEGIQIFYRQNEFHFCCFLCFSHKMFGGLPDDWNAEFNRFEVDVELRVNYWRRPSLLRDFRKENHRQMIRHISLAGDRWWDHHAFGEESVDLIQKERSRQYSGVIAGTLLHFPNLKKLDLVAGLVETFSDWRGELGQVWAPVLNILRRNRGILGVVWHDSMHHRHGHECDPYFFEREILLHKEEYMNGNFCAETKIELPLRTGKKLPLRETVFTLSDLEFVIREIVGTTAPGIHLYGERTIVAGPERSKHTIRFSGIPKHLAASFEHHLNEKQRTLRKNAEIPGLEFKEANCNCWTCIVGGRQLGEKPCPCCNCSFTAEDKVDEWDWYDGYLREEFDPGNEVWRWDFVPRECWLAPGWYYVRYNEDDFDGIRRVGRVEPKQPRRAFRKKERWGGRVPKWARGLDMSGLEEVMVDQGGVA
ncbi:hypothetical protein E6O75_ATG09768 [Venturia nashicola]|uniref:Uncharacterized protein n=1 Tax=Venturia nashicola TaxID=86259 RepID=A0A4Z1NZI5_9PEZI|nr:hypothetical protein E6O75_ATG09768 [Venturia nashicola]